MSTTPLFVEVLVIGIQAVFWIALIILSLFGYDWFFLAEPFLRNWVSLVTITFLAICYSVGIVVDRIADCFVKIISPHKLLLKVKWMKRQVEGTQGNPRIPVLVRSKTASIFLEYIRSRLRIARATALNSTLITAASSVFVLVRGNSLSHAARWNVVGTIIGVGLILVLLSLLSTGILEATYDSRVKQVERELSRQQAEHRKQTAT